MPQLACIDLSLGYEGKTVVKDLSFTVDTGDYLIIVGENGAGKTTLARTILGLTAPLSGRVETEGLRTDEIGYLPQQADIQKDFPASVREVVRSGCLNRRGLRPFYNAAEKRIAEENMEKLGIAGIAKHCYRELSGGQQRRALLARALCAAEKLLLLDEPAAGLDPEATAETYALIKNLNEGGVTVVMISHDVGAALKYATRILHIGGRGSAFFGPLDDYLLSGAYRAHAAPESGLAS